MLSLYAKGKDPRDCTIQPDIILPIELFIGNQLSNNDASIQFRRGIQSLIDKHFDASNGCVSFIDDENDTIILDDNDDAYAQALISITKNDQQLLKMHIDADLVINNDLNLSIGSDQQHTITTTPSTISAYSTIDQHPPAWLDQWSHKMRNEIKEEMLQLMNVNNTTIANHKHHHHHGRRSSHRIDTIEMPNVCDECQQEIIGVQWHCLRTFDRIYPYYFSRKCGILLCVNCFTSVGHPDDHAMLRISPNYRGMVRKLVSQAELIMHAVRQTTKPKRTSIPIENETIESKVIAIDEYAAVLESESKTGLMNDLGGGIGAYWKQWKIKNCGTKSWCDVKLHFIDSNSEKMLPFATTASIASSTEPGASIDVMVWMYGPIADAGLYRAHWRLHQMGESIDFGPVLSFEYVVDEKSPSERAGVDDDDFSIVSNCDDPDYELISDVNSVHTTSTNSGSPTPTPQLIQTFDEIPTSQSMSNDFAPIEHHPISEVAVDSPPISTIEQLDKTEIVTTTVNLDRMSINQSNDTSSLAPLHVSLTIDDQLNNVENFDTSIEMDTPLMDQSVITSPTDIYPKEMPYNELQPWSPKTPVWTPPTHAPIVAPNQPIIRNKQWTIPGFSWFPHRPIVHEPNHQQQNVGSSNATRPIVHQSVSPFAENMETLIDMGFTDIDENVELLDRFGNRIEETINYLLMKSNIGNRHN